MDDLDEIEEDVMEEEPEESSNNESTPLTTEQGADSGQESDGTEGPGRQVVLHHPSHADPFSPSSQDSHKTLRTPASRGEIESGRERAGSLLGWSDDDRKKALGRDGSSRFSDELAEVTVLPKLSLEVSSLANEHSQPSSGHCEQTSTPAISPACSSSPPASCIPRPSAPSPPPTPPSPALFQQAAEGEHLHAPLAHSPKLSAWGDEAVRLSPPSDGFPLGSRDELTSISHDSPQPSQGKVSPSPSSSRSASAGSGGVRKSTSPRALNVTGRSLGEAVADISDALLADVVAETILDVGVPRSAGHAHQRAHGIQSGTNSLSPRAASTAAASSRSGLVGRKPPERLRIERSPSPPGRSAPQRGVESRSSSASPSSSPSRHRGASAAVPDILSPDNRTPSPRSPRHGEAEAHLALSCSLPGQDVPSTAVPGTPACTAEGMSDAATAVMFVHEVLESVDDVLLANLESLQDAHFLGLANAKRNEDLPEYQHIYHKLIFDLLNEELGALRAEETRRQRGLSFRLGSDSVYGVFSAFSPRADPEAVRKEMLLRVAKLCAVGEPVARSLLPVEEADLEANLLDNAVERWVRKMEDEWLWCGEEEDAVTLSVVDAIFDDLLADSTMALLDDASQLEVSPCAARASRAALCIELPHILPLPPRVSSAPAHVLYWPKSSLCPFACG